MSVGRVGNRQLTQQILNNIRSQLQTQETLFEQISSNKRILRPSDDPTGTSRAMGARDHLVRLDQYETTINHGDVWTNITTSSLDNATQVYERVNEIAISADDGTKSAADLIAMAEELEQLLQHIVQISNTANQGLYIFGGGKTQTPPFRTEIDTQTGRITGVFYQGDSAVRKIKTQDHGATKLNILGSNAGDPSKQGAFIDSASGANAFSTIMDLRDKLLHNNTVGISGTTGDLAKITQVAQGLSASQVRLGGTQKILDLDRNLITEQNSNVSEFLSRVEDADAAQAILELNNAQSVYEAALAAGGRILQQGLLNFI
jgi:flagellar hook-associated protein 3 FlgL